MTFNEAEKMCERIEGYVIGSIVKGMKIDTLWIGPTNWNETCEYMNSQIQKEQEVTLLEFADRSFSVYGELQLGLFSKCAKTHLHQVKRRLISSFHLTFMSCKRI